MVAERTLVVSEEYVCARSGLSNSGYTAEYFEMTGQFHHPDYVR